MENEREILQDGAEDAARILEAKQFKKMTQTPIPRLIIGLGIPTTLSMMVTSLYNLADTYFVSLLKSDDITSAVGVLLALMSIIQAVGFTFGMGSGSIVSRLLGKHDKDGANKTASSAFFLSILCGILLAIIGFIFMTPLLILFGAGEASILKYAKDYAPYILISAPFMCASFVMNNVLRAEGKAVLSMIGLVVGAVVNVGLDPLFIFAFDLGIAGAAIATCISQCISFTVLLFMFFSQRTITRLSLRHVSFQFNVYSDVIGTGLPSFWRQILASLCAAFLNNAALRYGGAAAQASLTVVQKVFMLAFSLSLGIGQGYQPVLGYNYSSNRFKRVRSAYLFTLGFSTAVMVAFALVCGIFAPSVMHIFKLSDQATKIGALSLRLQCICMPLLPLNFMASVTYQALGDKIYASVLSVSRQGLFYIPAVLILPKLFKLFGVQVCQSVADFCAFLFAIPFTLIFFKRLKKNEAESEATQTDTQ